VISRADAVGTVDELERLVGDGQWDAADNLYEARGGNDLWKHLPAARLGQRAALAFVGTPALREACSARLGSSRMRTYVGNAGLWSMNAGDMTTAREFLLMQVSAEREYSVMRRPISSLHNLTECLGYLGEIEAARQAAVDALDLAESQAERESIFNSHGFLGWLAALSGDTAEAEGQFNTADQIEVEDNPGGMHMYSTQGIWWAEWLARTGRPGSALALTERNHRTASRYGWNEDIARCDRLLGRFALAAGNTEAAGRHLTAAAGCFRTGEYLNELAMTLIDLADYARTLGDFETASQSVAESIAAAEPGGLVAVQSAALVARARNCTGRSGAGGLLSEGREAADVALSLAARHHLAWHELDAMHAHAALDANEGTDSGWAGRADDLRTRLVPPGLDDDPLGTVDIQVGRQRLPTARAASYGSTSSARGEPEGSEVGAARDGAAVRRIGRQHMHVLVVVELSVVSEQPQHLHLHRPLPERGRAQAPVASLPGRAAIRHGNLVRRVARIHGDKLADDQPDCLILGMGSDAWLVAAHLRAAGISAGQSRREIIDELSQLDHGPILPVGPASAAVLNPG